MLYIKEILLQLHSSSPKAIQQHRNRQGPYLRNSSENIRWISGTCLQRIKRQNLLHVCGSVGRRERVSVRSPLLPQPSASGPSSSWQRRSRLLCSGYLLPACTLEPQWTKHPGSPVRCLKAVILSPGILFDQPAEYFYFLQSIPCVLEHAICLLAWRFSLAYSSWVITIRPPHLRQL